MIPRNDDTCFGSDMPETDAPELDSKIQSAIGRALEAHFQDLVSAPLPDRFLVLLAELEAKENSHGR